MQTSRTRRGSFVPPTPRARASTAHSNCRWPVAARDGGIADDVRRNPCTSERGWRKFFVAAFVCLCHGSDARPLVGKIAEKLSRNIMLATGQTEIYPVTMSFRPVESPGREANYWGISMTACETAIMDDEGDLLPQGQVGEIVHRGANAMLGYYKDPEATAAAQKFGWHHTGDLGIFDEGGQMLFLDRKKDMIKTGGENVPSIKVESALLVHPAVGGVAVIGVPHPRWAEAVCALVVLKPGAACTPEELNAHCRQLLGSFEVPKAIRIIDVLPMTATGKVQKQILRKQFSELFADRAI